MIFIGDSDLQMDEKNKDPKPITPAIIGSLVGAIPTGEYRLYSASSLLPPDVPWGGPDCQCVVIAGSAYSGPPITGISPNMAPSGPVYLWRAFRLGPGGSPPHKADDCLYYTNSNGDAFSLHSKDSPDHHTGIMAGSGLGPIIYDFNLPSGSSGKISEYKSGGAHLDFEGPFWKPKK